MEILDPVGSFQNIFTPTPGDVFNLPSLVNKYAALPKRSQKICYETLKIFS